MTSVAVGWPGWLVSADLPEESKTGALASREGGGGGWLNGWGTHCTVLAPDSTSYGLARGVSSEPSNVQCSVVLCTTQHGKIPIFAHYDLDQSTAAKHMVLPGLHHRGLSVLRPSPAHF